MFLLLHLCDRYGSVLIFDEVMTGFRVALGGAQAHYNVIPDLTTLGKIVGGGFPVGAFGGRADIMRSVAPLGKVYQAGTLSGNPVAMTAGLATLELICQPHFYSNLTAQTQKLMNGLALAAQQAHIPFLTVMLGGMFGLFFTEAKKITSEADTQLVNVSLFKQFFHAMLQQGVYLAPSAFEAGFVSSAHTDTEIAKTIKVAQHVFAKITQRSDVSLQAV